MLMMRKKEMLMLMWRQCLIETSRQAVLLPGHLRSGMALTYSKQNETPSQLTISTTSTESNLAHSMRPVVHIESSSHEVQVLKFMEK